MIIISDRKLDPADIALPPSYQIDVFARQLTCPINLVFAANGDILLADAGVSDGNGKVLKYVSGQFSVIADGFKPPLTGINVYQNHIYVSYRGAIAIITPGGKQTDILTGLPSHGDHHNNQVIFDRNGKMYFGQGTATNSGVVGRDNSWLKQFPFFHDYPGQSIRLHGANFRTRDLRTPKSAGNECYTGAFSPFGVPSKAHEKVKGITMASGSILRANHDGSDLELVAWGLRNPFRMKFDRQHQLFSTNHGMDERGSRPVANSPDEFQLIRPGMWYGFPDYTGGAPVTLPRFRPYGSQQPEFLLEKHPMTPPSPIAVFPPHSAAMGFDFNYDPEFGPVADAYVAEFGPGRPSSKPIPHHGHRISRIHLHTGHIYSFAENRSGYRASVTNDGGFERPIDVIFGPDRAMYVVDMGINPSGEGFVPKTGVIWRISRTH